MFPEFVPDKFVWAIAVLATVAVMMSHAHAGLPLHSVEGATLYAAASAPGSGGAFQRRAP